jgi:SAM-dependent methyltransferase
MIKISKTGFWDGEEAHLHHGYSQPLVDWIASFLNKQKNKPLYDFGCGIGQYLQQLSSYGFTNLTGFEGDPPKQKVFLNIVKQDLTVPFTVPTKGNCIFLEVAEHIPAELEKTTLDNIVNACGGYLIMSWALRGQGGHGHVNCLNNDEAIERFTSRGMIYLEKETESARAVIDPIKNSIEDKQLPWFKNTTLVFKKA